LFVFWSLPTAPTPTFSPYTTLFRSAEEALDFIMKSVEKAGFKPGEDVAIALDCAATEFYKDGKYVYEGEGQSRDAAAQAEYLAKLVGTYPIISIEDAMDEDDFDGWKQLTDLIGSKCQLVGDDLFVTNSARLSDGIRMGIANSILVKVNQIGTLSETLDAVSIAHRSRSEERRVGKERRAGWSA